MLKQKLILMVFLLIAGGITALADGYRSVLVSLKSGDVSQINLAEGMTTTFSGNTVVFRSGDFRVSFASADLIGFTFDESLGIDGVKKDVTTMTWKDGVLTLSNLPQTSEVSVYAVDGRCLSSETTSSETVQLNLGQWGAGNYVVKVNGVSHKITLGK